MIARVARAAKRSEPGMVELKRPGPVEKAGIFDVRAGPSTLDIIHAKLVQLSGYQQLVLYRECYAFALCSIPQRCIVYLNPGSHNLFLTNLPAARATTDSACPPALIYLRPAFAGPPDYAG